jgi:two-component system, chemotaxis family, protein-glutamate methylesterase/glutaminase
MLELVAIGASAGGLDALLRVLAPLPLRYPLPIAVVLHRGADEDGLAALLRENLSLQVIDVDDKQPIVPGCVFLAPPDYHLLVDRGGFSLSVDARVNSARPSIDVLFLSAAHAFRQSVLAVLLTGTSTDGMRGAAEVHRQGGQVVVQDPNEAEARLMPESAVAYADRVLTLAETSRYLQIVGTCTALKSPTI